MAHIAGSMLNIHRQESVLNSPTDADHFQANRAARDILLHWMIAFNEGINLHHSFDDLNHNFDCILHSHRIYILELEGVPVCMAGNTNSGEYSRISR